MSNKKYELQYGYNDEDNCTHVCANCIFLNETDVYYGGKYSCRHMKSDIQVHQAYTNKPCEHYYPKNVTYRIPKENRKNRLPLFPHIFGEPYVEISQKSLDFILNFVSKEEAISEAENYVRIEETMSDFGGVMVKVKKIRYPSTNDFFKYGCNNGIAECKDIELDATFMDDAECNLKYETELNRVTTVILVSKYNAIARKKNEEIAEYHVRFWKENMKDKKAYLDAKLKEELLPEDKMLAY